MKTCQKKQVPGQVLRREKEHARVYHEQNRKTDPYFTEERKKYFRELARKDIDQCLKEAEIALEELEASE